MPFEKGKIPDGSKPFKKGETGNPNGRPRKLPDLDILLANVLGKEVGQSEKTQAEVILESLLRQAKKGNVRAAEVLLERGYGKPKQDVEQKTIIYSVEVTLDEIQDISKAIKDGI